MTFRLDIANSGLNSLLDFVIKVDLMSNENRQEIRAFILKEMQAFDNPAEREFFLAAERFLSFLPLTNEI